MSMRRNVVERRRHNRFRVKDGASVVLRAHFLELGEIIDVSKGGLAFRYIPSQQPSNGLFQLAILLGDGSFYLADIPFMIISDFEINDNPFRSLKISRCGVQFGKLTRSQVSEMEYFIQRYATRKV